MTRKQLKACQRVLDAYKNFGPVDDGRPEGDEFEASLDGLSEAAIEAKVSRRYKADLLAATERCLKSLEWCAQWITGDEDLKLLQIDIDAVKAAVSEAKS